MAVSSPETPLLKKQKLDTDDCQTKDLISVSDPKAEEDSCADTDTDTDADADADTDTDTDTDTDIDPKRMELLRRLDNFRDMTIEEENQYCDMVHESEGFDVPYFPNVSEPGQIQPILRIEDCKEKLERYTNMAVDKYNADNHSDYHLKKVVKANCEPVAGLMYYITFEATSGGAGADAELETFQAKVWYGVMNRIEVMLCRKKTSAK